MSNFFIWLVIGAGLIVGELLTGTLYLLIFGIAVWCGAAAAYAGYSIHYQLAAAGACALVGLILFVPYDVKRRKHKQDDVDLDIGNEVKVEAVLGPMRVKVFYRGSSWDATVEAGKAGNLRAGDYCLITAVRGNILVVEPIARA